MVRFRSGSRWGGFPVENVKGKGSGEGRGVVWELAKEPASQCACVCQNYPLTNYPLVNFSPKNIALKTLQFNSASSRDFSTKLAAKLA